MDTKTFLLSNIIENIEKQSVTEFKCGDFLGPFSLKNSETAVRVTLNNFTGEPMILDIEASPAVSRIQCPQTPLLANCALLQTGAFIQILFTKDVMKGEPLRAVLIADMNYWIDQKEKEKKYDCPKCHMAKFNSHQNLKIHEKLYCPKREMEEASTTNKSDSKNLILLPLAFHDMPQQNVVQVMGPIHSVVPVAVGRQTTSLLSTNPLFVHNKCNLEMPMNLNISSFQSQHLSVKIPLVDLNEKISTSTTPLDLSRASLSPSGSRTSKSSSNEPISPEKPFSCSCGVSFSTQTTFDAHKQFYCMHTQTTSASSGGAARNDASRKVPDKCTKCDFMPISASQLAMHTRTAHQTTKTFTCLVCGYRAFSMRGVRTHMRSHPSEDSQKFKVNDPFDDK